MRVFMPQPDLERRVLAAILCSPTALRIAADLEQDDFAVAEHRWTFDAIRNLEAHRRPIGPVEVFAWLVELDQRLGTFRSHTVTVLWLGLLIVETEPYGKLREVFDADLRQLRTISRSRRAALEAAA